MNHFGSMDQFVIGCTGSSMAASTLIGTIHSSSQAIQFSNWSLSSMAVTATIATTAATTVATVVVEPSFGSIETSSL